METFLLIFWLVPKNLNPSFSCGYCEYALKTLDKHVKVVFFFYVISFDDNYCVLKKL